jgi:hypothetical protein
LEELSRQEHSLIFKITKAIKNMNVKLQKEITNFINLKMKIALCKHGFDKNIDISFQSSQQLFDQLQEKIFQDFELTATMPVASPKVERAAAADFTQED